MSHSLIIKRFFDVLAASAVFIAGAPLMALIAFLVKKQDSGPVFFKQVRMGKNLLPFKIYKFRTMTVKKHGADALVWTAEEETRITKIGYFLRDYGLDELPQVINILKGEMSIIGPRPPLPAQVDTFTQRQMVIRQIFPGNLFLRYSI